MHNAHHGKWKTSIARCRYARLATTPITRLIIDEQHTTPPVCLGQLERQTNSKLFTELPTAELFGKDAVLFPTAWILTNRSTVQKPEGIDFKYHWLF